MISRKLKEELELKHWYAMFNSVTFTTSQNDLWYIDYVIRCCDQFTEVSDKYVT